MTTFPMPCRAAVAACLAALAVLPGTAHAQGGRFGAPTTEAERSLAALLRRVDGDDAVLDNLFNGRGDRGFRPSVAYGGLLTGALLRALVEAERAQVRSECNGRYKAGEICGLDYNPITCAQDNIGRPLVSTLDESDNGARIAVAGSARGPANATYRVVNENGRWKLDGVACGSGASFNMD